jgi:phage terminase small subunit
MPLNAKQQQFVAEYLKDLNATAAYKRAGYSGQGNVAEASASRLLSDVKVQEAIQAAMNRRAERVEVTQDYVLKTIVDTIERCSQAEPVRDKDGEETGEYKFDSGAVLKGAELLGRHLKLFTDKIDLGGKVEFSNITRKIVKAP